MYWNRTYVISIFKAKDIITKVRKSSFLSVSYLTLNQNIYPKANNLPWGISSLQVFIKFHSPSNN